MSEGTRIDVDLDEVTSPFTTVPTGTYNLELRSVELTKSKKGDPMIKAMSTTIHPETQEAVNIFDYWMIGKQDGKFKLKQAIVAKFGAYQKDYTLEELVGATFEAEVEYSEGDGEYGPSNRIKRMLVEV
jgi:hypothetical protein